MNSTNKIFISNLPTDATEFTLLKLLLQFGNITNFNFPVHKEGKLKGRTLGYCFVSYNDKKDSFAALAKLNKLKFSNSILIAKWAKSKEEDVEIKYEYDGDVIRKELENESGIINKERLCQVLEKSKTVHIQRKVENKMPKIDLEKKAINPSKVLKDKQAQIKKIEEALSKYTKI